MFTQFFFFKQKTAYEIRISDWSSDVCSSDLLLSRPCHRRPRRLPDDGQRAGRPAAGTGKEVLRSEERRVGKECVSVDLGGRRIIKKKNMRATRETQIYITTARTGIKTLIC